MFRSTQLRFAVIALFAVAAVSLTAVSARALNEESSGAGESGNSTFADPDEQVNIFGYGDTGRTTIRTEWFGAARHPTGPTNSIQALSEQRTRLNRRTPFLARATEIRPSILTAQAGATPAVWRRWRRSARAEWHLVRHCFRLIAAGDNASSVTQHHQPVRMVHDRVPIKRARHVEAIVAIDNGDYPFAGYFDPIAPRQTHGAACADSVPRRNLLRAAGNGAASLRHFCNVTRSALYLAYRVET